MCLMALWQPLSPASLYRARAVHHAHLTRLYTTDEVAAIRQKASQIRGAYKAPGQR